MLIGGGESLVSVVGGFHRGFYSVCSCLTSTSFGWDHLAAWSEISSVCNDVHLYLSTLYLPKWCHGGSLSMSGGCEVRMEASDQLNIRSPWFWGFSIIHCGWDCTIPTYNLHAIWGLSWTHGSCLRNRCSYGQEALCRTSCCVQSEPVPGLEASARGHSCLGHFPKALLQCALHEKMPWCLQKMSGINHIWVAGLIQWECYRKRMLVDTKLIQYYYCCNTIVWLYFRYNCIFFFVFVKKAWLPFLGEISIKPNCDDGVPATQEK